MKLSACCNDFFDRQIETSEKARGTDMLCLKNAIKRFLGTGSKDDAFDVYFCFSEIFKIFGGGYRGNTVKLLNTLADHELKAGALSEKHRDHYSHSVYVFSLGIAIYQINNNFKEGFSENRLFEDTCADDEFLHRWGLSALFHDVGYPFEMAFNNIREYTKNTFGKIEPLLTYTKIKEFTALPDVDKKFLSTSFGIDEAYVENMHTLFAYKISEMFGIEYSLVLYELDHQMSKSVDFIDHAYFSALIMMKNFLAKKTKEKAEYEVYIDACINMLLHSSFYRRNIGKEREISQKHPLAFLLMLCDDLQDFDRIGYGRKSKDEPLPRNCYLEQSEGKLNVMYAFNDNAITYRGDDGELKDGEYIVKFREKTQKGIKSLFNTSGFGDIKISVEISNGFKPSVFHLSASFFQNILLIAMKIHDNYLESPTYNKLEEKWDNLPLELKMSNILQAKSYAEKLNALGYFYDDRELLLEKVTTLTQDQIDELAIFEHKRWINEKKEMGWEHAEYDGNDESVRNEMRDNRKHNCLVEYDLLGPNDQKKDKETVEFMIPNLQKTGFSVYRANKTKTEERIIHIGVKGDRNISKTDVNNVKDRIREKLKTLSSNTKNKTIVICACAQGFDLLATEVAMELGLYVKVILPEEKSSYLVEAILDKDSKILYNKVESYKNKEIFQIPKLEDTCNKDLSRYIAANSNTLLAGWDGDKNAKEDGGTLYTINMAKKFGRQLEVIDLSKN